eukprot:TRINITY_DN25951_c0_g5_i1.p1 TRINITY_DN25951_c0_g5~~TRINITY_DN25951_c0_g5_i1.p1  ORF type:complete len:486 (-),score=30.31 TRINITY_DN25951_c0_g5_i1:49-1458(-)
MASTFSSTIEHVWRRGLCDKFLVFSPSEGNSGRAALATPVPLSSLYDVEGSVGSGSFGVCCFGTHRGTAKKCVVKKIDRATAPPEYLQEMLEDDTLLPLLRPDFPHPHVMQYFDFLLGKDAIYVTMLPLYGLELFDYIVEHAPLTEDICKRVSEQALSALSHIHKLRIIHRDIKLESFRFQDHGSAGNLVLFDFGLACSCESRPRTPCGSVPYVAPEVPTRCISPQVDLWSFGVSLYVMLTGCEPFPDITIKDLYARAEDPERTAKDVQVAFATAEFRAAPVSATALVSDLLVYDPFERLTAEDALRHMWFESAALGSDSGCSVDTCTMVSIDVRRESYVQARWSLSDLGSLGQADQPAAQMYVRFEVSCSETSSGESVYVVGSVPELGSWDPRKGRRLHTDASCFPLWCSKRNGFALPVVGEISFKFLVQREDLEGPVRWEDSENRTLDFTSIAGRGFIVKAEWSRIF